MLAYVGLDARRDVIWVTLPAAESIERFANGKVDAFMGFPAVLEELRARGLGRVVVNSATDRPWSQYFCCLVAANREFVRKYPAATEAVAARGTGKPSTFVPWIRIVPPARSSRRELSRDTRSPSRS